MLKCFLIFSIVFCFQQSISQPNSNIGTKHKLSVRFIVDDKPLDIKGRFTVILLNDGDTLKTVVNGTQLLIPKLEKDTGYTVIFRYGKYSLSFYFNWRKRIIAGQDMVWEFGVDNLPFNQDLGLLRQEDYKKPGLKQLQYCRFQPQEVGDGIQLVNEVEEW